MTDAEKAEAAVALMDWFVSQEIDEGDACDVMTVVLASVIGHNAKHDLAEQRVAIKILNKQVRTIIEVMEAE